jgi:hypothetical protein
MVVANFLSTIWPKLAFGWHGVINPSLILNPSFSNQGWLYPEMGLQAVERLRLAEGFVFPPFHSHHPCYDNKKLRLLG